jgi:hypothetical protein
MELERKKNKTEKCEIDSASKSQNCVVLYRLYRVVTYKIVFFFVIRAIFPKGSAQ